MRKSLRGKKSAPGDEGQEEKDADAEPPGSPLRPPSLINAQEVNTEKQVTAKAAPGGLEVQESDHRVEGAEMETRRAKIKGR